MKLSGQFNPSGSFTPEEGAPGTHWVGGCVDPRGGLDAVEKRKVFCTCRESKPHHSVTQPSQYNERANQDPFQMHFSQVDNHVDGSGTIRKLLESI
jgi:hypothetical protein